ncbi:MAG: BrnT family toxin [Candidatus Promineifilaceae bacterium]
MAPRHLEKAAAKHGATPNEVESVFVNRPQYRRLERGRIEGKDAYAAYGQTDAGRYLTIVFIRKGGGMALIISARDMDRKERKQYGR